MVEPGNSRHLLLAHSRRTLEANAATSISQCSAGAVVLWWESRVFTHGARNTTNELCAKSTSITRKTTRAALQRRQIFNTPTTHLDIAGTIPKLAATISTAHLLLLASGTRTTRPSHNIIDRFWYALTLPGTNEPGTGSVYVMRHSSFSASLGRHPSDLAGAEGAIRGDTDVSHSWVLWFRGGISL